MLPVLLIETFARHPTSSSVLYNVHFRKTVVDYSLIENILHSNTMALINAI
ncbi:MAG: hypothetical protein ACI9UN_005423 [Granulosicoccus sp.]|jgi:hypothetical protein